MFKYYELRLIICNRISIIILIIIMTYHDHIFIYKIMAPIVKQVAKRMQDTPPGETLDPTRKNWWKGLNKFQATKKQKTGIHKESNKHMYMYVYIYIIRDIMCIILFRIIYNYIYNYITTSN